MRQLLAEVFEIQQVSRFYPNRGQPNVGQIYLTVAAQTNRKDDQ
ncbi:hypothetical protein [Amycolatopsis sp. H20-H5]|nr:hypothetical protein [Amycolatopsis sp. H20-H5]MEC3977880.1 hypothetical protein [Amycolatopsis sp. H20-H5]